MAKKIQIISDELMLGVLLKEVLTEEGYDAWLVNYEKDAFHLFIGQPSDLIMLVYLPTEALQQMINITKHMNISIVVLTTYPLDYIKIEELHKPSIIPLMHPFSLDQVINMMNHAFKDT